MTGKLLANRTNRTISSDQRIADPRNVATLRERVETAGSPRFIPVRRGKEKIRKIWSQNLEQNSLFFHFRFLHFLNRFRIIRCIFRGRKLRNENSIISTKNLSKEGASRLSSSHLQLPRNCEIPARQIDTDFSKTNPTFEKTCFYAIIRDSQSEGIVIILSLKII